jgi:hypothetical protein
MSTTTSNITTKSTSENKNENDSMMMLELSQQIPLVLTIGFILIAIISYAMKKTVNSTFILLILLSAIVSIITNAIIGDQIAHQLMFINILVVIVCAALFYFKIVEIVKIIKSDPLYESSYSFAAPGKDVMPPGSSTNKYYNFNW